MKNCPDYMEWYTARSQRHVSASLIDWDLRDSKSKQTFLSKYGVDNPFRQIDKIKKATLAKYGVDNIAKLPEIKARQKATNQSRYQELWSTRDFKDKGVDLCEGFHGVKDKKSGKHIQYKVKCQRCGFEFTSAIGYYNTQACCPRCTNFSFRAKREIILQDFIESIGFKAGHVKHPFADVNELDILVPSKHLAIEFNGFCNHNSGFNPFNHFIKPPSHHADLTDICLNNGIRLIHLWEDGSLDLHKSIIAAKLGKGRRIDAFSLDLVTVSYSELIKFYNSSHIAGFAPASFTFALASSSEVYQAISIRLTKHGPEIARLASKPNYLIEGGSRRLLDAVIKELKSRGYSSLLSFCDRDLSPDPYETFYYRVGFSFIKDCGPMLSFWNYKSFTLNGTKYRSNSRIARQQVQKHKLITLPNFDSSKPYMQILAENAVYPLYNSGNFKYVLGF